MKLEEVLSLKDYIDHERKTNKKLDKLIEVNSKKLEQKFYKIVDASAKDS